MTPLGFSSFPMNNNYQFQTNGNQSLYSSSSLGGLQTSSLGSMGMGDTFQMQGQQDPFGNGCQQNNPLQMMMQMMQMFMGFMMQMIQMFMGMMGGQMPGQFGNSGGMPGQIGGMGSQGSNGAFAYASPNGAYASANSGGGYGGGSGGSCRAVAGNGPNGPYAAASCDNGNYDTQMSPGSGQLTGNFRPSVSRWGGLIEEKARKYGLDPNLVAAVIDQESKGNPNAGSPKGACGLMQLMPGTSREQGCSNPRDPNQNVEAGCKYLSKMIKANHGNVALGLASYNAGLGNVRKHGGIPPFKETQTYVRNIMGNYKKASANA